MRLIRFMSAMELQKYLNGETLQSTVPWEMVNKSSSTGFCFFPADPAPETRLHYISGVVSFDVVAEFTTVGPVTVHKGTGKYRDPERDAPSSILEALFTPVKMMDVTEYSLTQYNRSILKLIRVGYVYLDRHTKEWKIEWEKREKLYF